VALPESPESIHLNPNLNAVAQLNPNPLNPLNLAEPEYRGGFGTGIVESCKSWKFQCAPQARFFLDLQARIRGGFYVFGNSN